MSVPDVTPELPSGVWRLILRILGRAPAGALSRSFGRVADLPLPRRMRVPVLGTFARSVGIVIEEAERPLADYPTLNAFFVRRLRPGARQWPADPDVVVSPVDGIVGRFGGIDQGIAIQAKGRAYSVAELLDNEEEATAYESGAFATIYLSPRHYHRIHTPCAGAIRRAAYVPGALYPVNEAAVMHVPHLFTRNERLICHLEAAAGRIAVVAVGAYNVGRISAAFDPSWGGAGADAPWVTNRKPPADRHRSYAPPKRVVAGDELMAFHLGSTVVMLFDSPVPFRLDLSPGQEVRVGEPLVTATATGGA